jgi:hypothetical protein
MFAKIFLLPIDTNLISLHIQPTNFFFFGHQLQPVFHLRSAEADYCNYLLIIQLCFLLQPIYFV